MSDSTKSEFHKSSRFDLFIQYAYRSRWCAVSQFLGVRGKQIWLSIPTISKRQHQVNKLLFRTAVWGGQRPLKDKDRSLGDWENVPCSIEIHSRSHPALWLCTSILLCLPFKTLSRGSLSSPLVSFPLSFVDLHVASPIQKERTWMGFPSSTASQPGTRRPCGKTRDVPCTKNTWGGGWTAQEDNSARVNSDLLLPRVFSSRVHSPALSSLVSQQFVNRSLLTWFAVCNAALLSTPPSFLPPPSLPPFLYLKPLLSFSFHQMP